MLQTKNNTPFPVHLGLCPDEDGIDSIYPLVKATFCLNRGVRVADEQRPIVLADEYIGKPGESSLSAVSEVLPLKPATDVLLIGSARAPRSEKVDTLDVTLRVKERTKTVRVTGDRTFSQGFFRVGLSYPVPFNSMPLIYENSFGGCDVNPKNETPLAFEDNPLGKGFYHKKGTKSIDHLPAPNLESVDDLIVVPSAQRTMVCFAPVCPQWPVRYQYAGTYDEAWQKKRAPYLPEDFNSKFYNIAPVDQQFAPYLVGDETIEVSNIARKESVRFVIPHVEWGVMLKIASQTEQIEMVLETVVIDARDEEPLLEMVWKGKCRCDKRMLKMQLAEFAIERIGSDIEGLSV